MNRLENQVRSWAPRRPSARLERRWAQPKRPLASPGALFAWLVPATACVLLLGLVGNQRASVAWPTVRGTGDLVALSLSNQSFAAYLPGSFQPQQNRWDTFEWTKGSDFPSSERPFLQTTQTIRTPHGQD